MTLEPTAIAIPEPSGILSPGAEPDVLAQLLGDKRSLNTKAAYAKDLRDFFRFVAEVKEPTKELVKEFLSLDQFAALSLVLRYKSHLVNERNLK